MTEINHCHFCELTDDRIIDRNETCVVVHDLYPVTPLHTLIITKRHVPSYFDLNDQERGEMQQLIDKHRKRIEQEDESVSGFNIGINCGKDAGQTVMHCHVHLIPRRKGDIDNPRGGVRGVIPDKQSYQATGDTVSKSLKGDPKTRLDRKVPLPHQKMLDVLQPAYEPCQNFKTCPEAKWEPKEGEIPRGYLGCTGELEEVEAVFVFAEPGHPQLGETYTRDSPLSIIEQVIEESYRYKSEGDIDQFHKNLLWLMDELWPKLSFDERLRKVWITESRLCSIDNEIGNVRGENKTLCTQTFLIPQIKLLPNATVVLFGVKARERVGQLIPEALTAWALAPPGANNSKAKASWELAVKTIQGKRQST